KAKRESFPLRANPQNARFNSGSEYQVQDRIVFIEIAHTLVWSAVDDTTAHKSIFGRTFEGDVTKRYEPGTRVFLGENSLRNQQRPAYPSGSEDSAPQSYNLAPT